jgi:PAS domain S-box-containing protein
MERISILEKNLMEISQRENLYRRIFERAITPILVLDHSGNVVFMNFLARKLLGVESEKVIFNILKDPNSSDWFCKKYKERQLFLLSFI